MPPPFRQLTVDEFAALVAKFPFQRKINAVHMHHTWRPNRSQYRGHETIVAMWRYHTQTNGWSDIAQHLTIAPDGTLWTGRSWNRPPASSNSHNGSRSLGPFMFEMIGDFDTGKDRFDGPQREAALRVITLVQKRFGLPPETLRFHNQMSPKSCPGSSISYGEILAEVRAHHQAAREGPAVAAGTPVNGPFPDEALALHELLACVGREAEGEDPAEAELAEGGDREGEEEPDLPGPGPRDGTSTEGELTPDVLARLRPHVVNLNQGRFSEGGLFHTDAGDIDALFGEHLPRELAAARAAGEKLRLLFWAHGGLVSESNALRQADRHLDWWRQNGVYPVYFIWETGFLETVGQLLSRAREQVREGLRDAWDWTSDPLVEAAARALYGPAVWGGMKYSAERAAHPADGGAYYLAERLAEFCKNHGEGVELHAAGHSAGAIFHAEFLSACLEVGVPSFRSVHFLAPAIRVDAFRALLGWRSGPGKSIEHLTVYTMSKDRELADHCAHLYHKSLLYLLYYALEPAPKTPILGLEVSLRADPELRRLFGLAGAPAAGGEVIWSPTPESSGRSACTALSHGGFGEDPATLQSILRRVRGLSDSDPIVEPLPAETGRDLIRWDGQVDWPDELRFPDSGGKSAPSSSVAVTKVDSPPTPPLPVLPAAVSPSGRRRALCVGINDYPTAPLAGAVADAEAWRDTLIRLGFEPPQLLRDGQATRSAILEALEDLVTSSQAGDVVVFQFAGHGTQLPDVSGDENEELAALDEAICPYDFAEGRFVLDDDIAGVFAAIPPGVNVTCFIDCCHSGTISRFAVGSASGGADLGERPRFVRVSPEVQVAHQRFRQNLGRGRAAAPRGPETLRHVVFSACRAEEVAWERDGGGEFTGRASRLLREGAGGLTHRQFQQRVTEAFGVLPRQHPELDCAPAAADLGLLQPLSCEAFGVSTGDSVLPGCEAQTVGACPASGAWGAGARTETG